MNLPFAARQGGAALRGAPNFRDLGGLTSGKGGEVRHGHVFRSGHLGDLQPEDIRLLQSQLGVSPCVIDLRGAAERSTWHCVLPGAVVYSLPVEPTVSARLVERQGAGELVTPEVAAGFMRNAYRGFVARTAPQLRAIVLHLLEDDARPLVLHCHAGKDRTGYMAAMLLTALDVPRSAVLEDYLCTNERVSPRDAGRFPPEIMRVLTSVRSDYLEAALETIDQDHGGPEAYLQHRAGLTPAQLVALRARLLG